MALRLRRMRGEILSSIDRGTRGTSNNVDDVINTAFLLERVAEGTTRCDCDEVTYILSEHVRYRELSYASSYPYNANNTMGIPCDPYKPVHFDRSVRHAENKCQRQYR